MANTIIRNASCIEAIVNAYRSISGQPIGVTKLQIVISLATPGATKGQIRGLIVMNEKKLGFGATLEFHYLVDH